MKTNEQLQLQMEKRYAKQNTIHTLKKALGEQKTINDVVTMLEEYLAKTHSYSYEVNKEIRVREDLLEAHAALRKLDLTNLIYSLFCHVWSKNEQVCTVQELAGMCINKLDGISSLFRKLTAVEIILTAFSECKLIEVDTTYGETLTFRCRIPLTMELMEETTKQGYVLPSIVVPEKVCTNRDIGYKTFKSSLILGGKFHERPQNLNHINRINSVAFEYEHRLELLTEPVFNMEPKVKNNGQWESQEDIVTRYRAFKQLHDSLPDKVDIMKMYSDKFYLVHAYDTRGRSYVKAFEFNYQGSGYLKAMVNLNNKEIIKEEF